MPTFTEQLTAMLESAADALDRQHTDILAWAAAAADQRDNLRARSADIKDFIMRNATELVKESIDTIDAKDAEIADLQKQIADAAPRVVDQATLDALDVKLNPAGTSPAPASNAADVVIPPAV